MSSARPVASAARLARQISDELFFLSKCYEAGMLRPEPPRRALAIMRATGRWGPLGGSVTAAALRHPDRVALVDERGELTYRQLDDRANRLANGLRSRGLRAGDGVAILARNHRGFLDASFACAKLGARAIYLNTDFAGPQIREVAAREGAAMLIHDEEYANLLEGYEPPLGRLRAWADSPGEDTLDTLIERSGASEPPKPAKRSVIVILTSGTTGTPKGAPRPQPRSLAPLGAMFEKVPFRAGEATVVCAPLFHALGFAHAVVAVGLGSKLVLRRRFDPVQTVADVAEQRATALVVVPVMLARLLDLGDEQLKAHDTSALRIVFVAGSQLGGELCRRAMDAFGPVIYNLYGSTEVSYATIATPEDLRAEPACVGRCPRGAVVKILDESGRELPTGETGRIFVGNATAFEGYTSGETKEVINGLMSSGDVGHVDAAGRLFIDGRDDEMIVSGGENVFPREIEELLATHPEIDDAAAIGVADERWGERLRAFVVRRPGSPLEAEDVRGFVRDNLARYKVPRDVVFIDELPRNPTGKVLKRELAALEP